MKILQVHNCYQQNGGEDVVVLAERELLRSNGHDVELYSVTNDAIKGVTSKIKTAWCATYSSQARHRLASTIAKYKPDVVHAHNLFPLLSPSVYDACLDARVPVVQTLHNFRTICPGALLLRKGDICEQCLNRSPYWACAYRCYREDFLGSLAVARMVRYHHKHFTWRKKVDRFIALTEFAKNKFVQSKFPAEKISVKPNFCSNSTGGGCGSRRREYAIFVGRLSEEKGVRLMMEAWKQLSGVPLKIVGDGPLADWVAKNAGSLPDVEWLGLKSRADVLSLMEGAVALVFPSIWYEGFPMTIVEAYSVGLPVIAGDLGSMSTLVDHQRTGLHFRPGDASDLATKISWAFSHREEMSRMRYNVSTEFHGKYSSEKNYRMLHDIYERVIHDKKNEATR